MKLELHEATFVLQAFDHVQIKASDAPAVAKMISKVQNEVNRLQKASDQSK